MTDETTKCPKCGADTVIYENHVAHLRLDPYGGVLARLYHWQGVIFCLSRQLAKLQAIVDELPKNIVDKS